MVTLYKAEAELFEDIRIIRFGELYDVEVLEEGGLVEMDLCPNDEILLGLLQKGVRSFHTIGVHNGQPSFAIVKGRSRFGNRFRKRIKIP